MTKEQRFLAVSFFLPLIGLFLSGTLPAWAETPTAPPETIILISLDTTRADHLSCYGYEHETTPNIDALAKQSLFFEHPFAPAPMTQPSHASMFTGTLPPTHGVHENLVSNLSPSVLTLAEILKQHDFTTYIRQLFAIYHGTKQYSKAIETLNKIIALEPDDAMAYTKLMSIYMEQGGNAKAVDTMQRRRAVVPDDLESLMMLGQAYQRLNDAPNALTCFLDALALAPNSVDAHVGARGTYYKMRNLRQALSHYKQALALDTNQPNVHRQWHN